MAIIQGAGAIGRTQAGVPGAGTSEVQTLTLSDVPGKGKWQVKFNGWTTADLDWNITAADLQVALRALPSIGGAHVGVGLVGQVYTLTFTGNLGKLDLPACTVPSCSIKTAGDVAITVAVATTTPGVTAAHRGAPIGALVMDTTNGDVYVNSGSAEAPTWEKVGGQ